jgi:hypothetical protein
VKPDPYDDCHAQDQGPDFPKAIRFLAIAVATTAAATILLLYFIGD